MSTRNRDMVISYLVASKYFCGKQIDCYERHCLHSRDNSAIAPNYWGWKAKVSSDFGDHYSQVDVKDAPKEGSFTCSFYSLNFKKYCSFLYGRQPFDHEEGTLHCTAPGQIITYDKQKERDSSEGFGLYFHPELIRNTALGNKINDYTFLSYNTSEALHLSEQEKQILPYAIWTN